MFRDLSSVKPRVEISNDVCRGYALSLVASGFQFVPEHVFFMSGPSTVGRIRVYEGIVHSFYFNFDLHDSLVDWGAINDVVFKRWGHNEPNSIVFCGLISSPLCHGIHMGGC